MISHFFSYFCIKSRFNIELKIVKNKKSTLRNRYFDSVLKVDKAALYDNLRQHSFVSTLAKTTRCHSDAILSIF